MADRCPVCDREDCPTLTMPVARPGRWYPAPDPPPPFTKWHEVNHAIRVAKADCRTHRIDWRTRALDAERLLAAVEAECDRQMAEANDDLRCEDEEMRYRGARQRSTALIIRRAAQPRTDKPEPEAK